MGGPLLAGADATATAGWPGAEGAAGAAVPSASARSSTLPDISNSQEGGSTALSEQDIQFVLIQIRIWLLDLVAAIIQRNTQPHLYL